MTVLIRASFWLAIFLAYCSQLGQTQEFNPTVTARCERGYMIINVSTKQPFHGIIHTRDYRNKPHCFVTGNGGRNTTLRISAVASRGETSYCGVSGGQDTDEERHAAIAVRVHRTIELQDDKYFLISCAQSSFYSGRNRVRSRVRLQLLNRDASTTKHRLAIGGKYLLRAELQQPAEQPVAELPTPLPSAGESTVSSVGLERLIAADYRLFLRQCIAFGQLNASETLLIDSNGCSTDRTIIQPFRYTPEHRNGTQAHLDALIESMFKLPDSNRLHIQCDALLCAPSAAALCERRYTCGQLSPRAGSAAEVAEDPNTNGGSIVRLITATTVYVLDADQTDPLGRLDGEQACSEWNFPWLIALCAILGSLLLIMLLINICLCGSLTCSCGRQEQHTSEEDSTLDDYEPYKVDWSPAHVQHYSDGPGAGGSLSRAHSAYDGYGHELVDDPYDPALAQRSLSRYSTGAPYGKQQPTGYHNYGYR